jgi:cytochrome c553
MKAKFLILSLVSLVALGHMPARAEIDGNPRHGAELYEKKGCVACHGEDGLTVAAEVPHLAGQHRTYLFDQMASFRSSRSNSRLGYKISERRHPGMSTQTKALSNTDISDIAAYLNRLPCSPGQGPAIPPDRPVIATKCEFCHGTQGHSPFIQIPVITGQREDYIVRQLREFRDAAADFWATNLRSHRFILAAKMDLTDVDISTAAKYYARLSCR